MEKKRKDRVELFSSPTEEAAFLKSQNEWLSRRQSLKQAELLNPENSLRYSHGGDILHPADKDSSPDGLEEHSATWELKFDDIKEQNLDKWAKGLVSLSDAMHDSVMGMMIRTINDATERTGNVVNVKEAGSFAKSMFQMLEKIELGVDRNGEVSMPTIMLPPGEVEKRIAELDAQPQEFKDRFETLKAKKEQEARDREAARLSRFKGGGA